MYLLLIIIVVVVVILLIIIAVLEINGLQIYSLDLICMYSRASSLTNILKKKLIF